MGDDVVLYAAGAGRAGLRRTVTLLGQDVRAWRASAEPRDVNCKTRTRISQISRMTRIDPSRRENIARDAGLAR